MSLQENSILSYRIPETNTTNLQSREAHPLQQLLPGRKARGGLVGRVRAVHRGEARREVHREERRDADPDLSDVVLVARELEPRESLRLPLRATRLPAHHHRRCDHLRHM